MSAQQVDNELSLCDTNYGLFVAKLIQSFKSEHSKYDTDVIGKIARLISSGIGELKIEDKKLLRAEQIFARMLQYNNISKQNFETLNTFAKYVDSAKIKNMEKNNVHRRER